MLIIVKIRRLQGKDEEINIDNACTISELKQTLHQRLGIDPSQQRLIFCGHVLDDIRTISDCNIGDNQVVHMVTSSPPFPARSQQEPDLSETENASGPPTVGQSSFVFVSHEDQGSTSPTAIRLRILHTVVSELRTRILELDSGADVESSRQAVEDNPVAEFARLIEEIHRLDRLFETHRENYIGIINEIRDTNGSRDERSIQARMRYSEQINGVFHSFAHAFHLISDIAMLESPNGTQLASEAFLRYNRDETGIVETHSGRIGNMDGNNDPFNVEIDPIMIQLQIETSETTMAQRNAANPPPDADMDDLNPDELMQQDANFSNPQEYLRSLQQRMLNIEQHVEHAARELEIYIYDEAIPYFSVSPTNNISRVGREIENAEGRPHNSGLRSTAAALDFGMEVDDSPLGNANFQEFLGNSPNLAENTETPGSVPTDLIQQILSSVLRNEVQDAHWPNPDQNATPPAPNPENDQTPRRTVEDSPGHEARRDLFSNIVYDQAMPCESRHIPRALHLRSGNSSAEPLQHNDSVSTRAFFTIQSLYDRLERNPRSPDNLVIACFLLLRESLVPTESRYLGTMEVLLVGDVVVNFFRGLLLNITQDQSVMRVTDIIISRHTQFFRRVPLMVDVCQGINMTASIRAVLTHHLPAIFNLISIRDPNEFSRIMRSVVPEFYHDISVVLFQCVEEACMALETVYRAYLIDCVRTMDDTNRDLLMNVAFYCMSVGVYRASMSLDEPANFIVPRNTLDCNTCWTDEPQPSTSRATESNVNLARDMYSGNLPRARPSSTSRVQSMRIRSVIPVDANRPTRNTSSEMPRPQPGTNSAKPPVTEAPASTAMSVSGPDSTFVPDSACSASTSTSATAPSGSDSMFLTPAPSASTSTSAPSASTSTSAPSASISTSAPSASTSTSASAPSGPDSMFLTPAPSASTSASASTPLGPDSMLATPAPSASTSSEPEPRPSTSSAPVPGPSSSSVPVPGPSSSSEPVPGPSTSATNRTLPMALVQFVSSNMLGDTPAYTLVNESNVDWWTLEDDQLIARDEESESGRESPSSDAYHVGNSQHNQEILPTELDAFAEYVFNELGETTVVNDHLRSMFLSFICRSVLERIEQSPDYDHIKFLATRLLTDDTISPEDRRRYEKELRRRWKKMRSFDRNK
ncbi:uncharacterized protein LOC110997565 isoform X2 [Pieris rapae]|uniref:uncharacterized protein LOC110997565 isoform X2 n=1 Tax=Pieris rapae TaxID=64459 RepID=UPI001E27C26C|nr:uncharacterized protein LOC110997565 isoform X2 [Pieris rapae]